MSEFEMFLEEPRYGFCRNISINSTQKAKKTKMKKTILVVLTVLFCAFGTQTSFAQVVSVHLVQGYIDQLQTGSENQKETAKANLIGVCTSKNIPIGKMHRGVETPDGVSKLGVYAESLMILKKQVTVLRLEMDGNKISKIYVSETY